MKKIGLPKTTRLELLEKKLLHQEELIVKMQKEKKMLVKEDRKQKRTSKQWKIVAII